MGLPALQLILLSNDMQPFAEEFLWLYMSEKAPVPISGSFK